MKVRKCDKLTHKITLLKYYNTKFKIIRPPANNKVCFRRLSGVGLPLTAQIC